MCKLLYILFSLLLMSACVHRPTSALRSLMEEAEGMIHTCPDTAYFLLREMGASMDLDSDADRACYGLLLMEAQVKNRMKLTDTAALQELADYYKKRPDSVVQARLLRLRAVAHRDGGRYEEAVRSYDAATKQARRIGDRLLLVDIYQELAHLHYFQGLRLCDDSFYTLSDSLYNLTEKEAKELQDTVLWINALIGYARTSQVQKELEYAERRLLYALDLAIALEDKRLEADVSMHLSLLYAEMKKKKESLFYIRQNLALRKNVISDFLYCSVLGNAYRRVGEKDSADFYLRKRANFNAEEFSIKKAVSLEKVSLIDLIKRKKEFGQDYIRKNSFYKWLIFILLVIAIPVAGAFKVLKKRKGEERNLRKSAEELCAVLDEEKKSLIEKLLDVRTQLKQKEKDLQLQQEESKKQLFDRENLLREVENALQKERDELRCKEQEIELLQQQLDKLSSDAVRIYDKIKQIIADFRYKNESDLRMEETDWRQLQVVMDKQWNNSVVRMQDEYQLSDMDVRLLCLKLMDIPKVHMLYLLGFSRNTLYTKEKELLEKMCFVCTSKNFKDDFGKLVENLK